MQTTVGDPHDVEFTSDLDTVARTLPGKGPALGRIIERAQVTQKQIAEHLDCDRSAISHWIREKKWLKPRKLLDLLIFLRVERSLLTQAAASLTGEELPLDVFRACGGLNLTEVTKEKMLELIAGQEDLTQRGAIINTFTPLVTLAVSLKAAGMKGAESVDVKAAQLFFQIRQDYQTEVQLKGVGKDRVVTKDQASWSSGHNVYQDDRKDRKPEPATA